VEDSKCKHMVNVGRVFLGFIKMKLEEMQRILGGRDEATVEKEMAYGEVVASLGCDTYLTGTFRNKVVNRGGFEFEVGYGVESAAKAFRRFVARNVPGCRSVYAVEKNPSREGHHVHALLRLSGRVRRDELWEDWWDKYGTNRIVPVEQIGGVAAYVSKYCVTGFYEWGILNSGASPAKPVHDDLFVNSAAAIVARRSEADRMIERWGKTSRPQGKSFLRL
jgi:hypothetical protein